MSGKEFMKDLLQSFFIVVTLINAAMFFLGRVLQPNMLFGYEIFLYPLLYGLCSMIPVAVMHSRRELTIREALIRKAIQLVLIMILLILLIFDFKNLTTENVETIAGVCASIIIIYVLTEAISWLLSNRKAKKLTDELLAYQKEYQQNSGEVPFC